MFFASAAFLVKQFQPYLVPVYTTRPLLSTPPPTPQHSLTKSPLKHLVLAIRLQCYCFFHASSLQLFFVASFNALLKCRVYNSYFHTSVSFPHGACFFSEIGVVLLLLFNRVLTYEFYIDLI